VRCHGSSCLAYPREVGCVHENRRTDPPAVCQGASSRTTRATQATSHCSVPSSRRPTSSCRLSAIPCFHQARRRCRSRCGRGAASRPDRWQGGPGRIRRRRRPFRRWRRCGLRVGGPVGVRCPSDYFPYVERMPARVDSPRERARSLAGLIGWLVLRGARTATGGLGDDTRVRPARTPCRAAPRRHLLFTRRALCHGGRWDQLPAWGPRERRALVATRR
jgi:hypothetical protein